MMSISTKGRYATRIVVLLASRAGSGRPVTKYEVAEAEGISPEYVQQLMSRLKIAGLVVSHRGTTGGFSIGRDPATITVGEVLRATEGKVAPAPCYTEHHCEREDACPTRPVWDEAARLLNDLFERTTVADLVAASTEGRR
jgi:Rrf2 family protein